MDLRETKAIEVFWVLGPNTTDECRLNLVTKNGEIEHFKNRLRAKLYPPEIWNDPNEFIIYQERGKWRYKCEILREFLSDEEWKSGLKLEKFDGENAMILFYQTEDSIIHIHCRK